MILVLEEIMSVKISENAVFWFLDSDLVGCMFDEFFGWVIGVRWDLDWEFVWKDVVDLFRDGVGCEFLGFIIRCIGVWDWVLDWRDVSELFRGGVSGVAFRVYWVIVIVVRVVIFVMFFFR